MLASAPPAHYQRALAVLCVTIKVDSVIVIFIPPLVTDADEVAAAIAAVRAARPRQAGTRGVHAHAMRRPGTLAAIPSYAFPEPAALALSRVTAYGEWRRQSPGEVPSFPDMQEGLARAVVDTAIRRGGGWLSAVEANALVSAAGITTPRSHFATSVDEAVEAAVKLGLPVVLKAVGAALLHKTEHRALRLNLDSIVAVRRAAVELTEALGDRMDGLLVQAMVGGGAEMMVGAINDPLFGHVVVCGSGGVLVDLLADSACRLHPVTDQDAHEMVEGLKGVRLLRGFRGAEPADEASFRDAILRISALIGLCPEIQELDLNPVKVLPGGVSAIDVRIRVA